MRSFRDRYVISSLPDKLQDSDLGPVVEAYDSRADRSWGCLMWWVILVLVCLGMTIANLVMAPDGIAKLPLVEQLCPFAIVAVGVIVYFVLLSHYHMCQRIYVCGKGVHWEKYNYRSGRVAQSRTVLWEQVHSVVSRKTRHYSRDSRDNDTVREDRYKHTIRTLELLAPHGDTLLKIQGKYSNEHEQEELFTWIWFAVKAVERQWAIVRLPVLLRQVHSEGQLLLTVKGKHTLQLTPDALSYKDKTISGSNLVVRWSSKDETLALRDDSEKRNAVQKFFNLKEVSIPVSTMPNGCLVQPLLLQLYGVQPV